MSQKDILTQVTSLLEEAAKAKSKNSLKNIRVKVRALHTDMDKELKLLAPEERMFANFLRGKLTAYLEVMDLLKDENISLR